MSESFRCRVFNFNKFNCLFSFAFGSKFAFKKLLMRTLGIRLAMGLGVFGAGVAAAQTVSSFSIRATSDTSATEVRFGPNSCGNDLSLTYRILSTLQICSGNLQIWATAGACAADKPGADDLSLVNRATNDLSTLPIANGYRSDVRVFKLSTLPAFSAPDGGGACGTLQGEKSFLICGTIPTSTQCTVTNPVNTAAETLKVIYDNKAPAAPTLSSAEALDSSLKLTIALTDADIKRVIPQFRKVSGDGGTVIDVDGGTGDFVDGASIDATSSTTSLTVKNLKNGTTYLLRLVAVDGADNVSAPSETVIGTPILTQGFVDALNSGGEYKPSGCSSTASGLALIAGLAMVVARMGRTKKGVK